MFNGHSDKFSLKGGKCPTVILTSFHKKEENVPASVSVSVRFIQII